MRTSWNKGLKTPLVVRKKQSQARMGKVPWNKGVKGTHFSPSTEFKKGIRASSSTEFSTESVKGEKNNKWKGDQVGYNALHFWVRRNFGTPNTCEHCLRKTLTRRSYNWANKTGRYLRERSDWLRLCVSCHKKYDLSKNKKELYEAR